MDKNLRMWDRLLRLVLGTFFLAWAIAGGPFWAYAGLYLLWSGAFGFSPLYFVLRINSSLDKPREPAKRSARG